MAVFRVLFGLLGAYSAVRFLFKGWVESLYLAPDHHLTYAWFTWVRPLPAPLMYCVVGAMVPLGLAIAAGWRTRLSAGAFLIVFAYCELIDAALYLNHYWYMTLALALVVVLPLSGQWSLDARAARVTPSATVAALVVWVLRGQLAVVYVMAGLGKLNHDWLVRGEPMGMWLASRTDTPIIGAWFREPWIGRAASWLGVAFDLTIVGWLLWRRTRLPAYLVLVVFHVVTWRLFAIGVFPWVMVAGTLMFFDPAWPRRVARCLHLGGNRVVPRSGRESSQRAQLSPPRSGERQALAPAVLGAAVLWAVLQLAVPLRHLVYAGDVRWTEEGYYGSFRVMLTEKAGLLSFEVTDPGTGETWIVEPTDVLTGWQAQQAAIRADLALAAAHLVADEFDRRGHPDVEVRADSWVSFNGRPRQRMIDPSVDLAELSRRAPAGEYVLALDPPVPQ